MTTTGFMLTDKNTNDANFDFEINNQFARPSLSNAETIGPMEHQQCSMEGNC